MNATSAFRGDLALKSSLMARIEHHLANETLVFGPTHWDGVKGSAIGVSIEAVDPAEYAAVYGYPLPLVLLLDVLASLAVEPALGRAFVRDWVSAVSPGGDLSPVPVRLVLYMLDDRRMLGINDDLHHRLVALHNRELEGEVVARNEWSKLRRAILDLHTDNDSEKLVIRMWEASAWPARNGRSTLTDAFYAWRQLQSLFDDPSWNSADEHRKERLLHSIADEEMAAGKEHDQINFHLKLVARDKDLADRFVANLKETNRRVLGATTVMADKCIEEFRSIKIK